MKDENFSFFIDENQKESFFVTLTDLETGKDREFEVVAEAILEGKRYIAMVHPEENDVDVAVFETREEDGSLVFETIVDDDEYEMVEDYFNDLLFGSTDYDN